MTPVGNLVAPTTVSYRDAATALWGEAGTYAYDSFGRIRDALYPELPARLARALSGCVVVPDKLGRPPRRWIGRAALAEASAFAGVSKNVRAYIAGELVPWADLTVRRNATGSPRWLPVEVIAPRFAAAILAQIDEHAKECSA